MYLYIYYRATEIRYFRSTFRSPFFSSIHALKRSVWSQKRTIEEGELTYALTLPRIKIYVYVSTRWLISIQLNTDALADNAMLIGLWHSRSILDRFIRNWAEKWPRRAQTAPRDRARFLPRTREWSTCLDFIETLRWFTVRWLPTGFQEMQTYRSQTIPQSSSMRQ